MKNYYMTLMDLFTCKYDPAYVNKPISEKEILKKLTAIAKVNHSIRCISKRTKTSLPVYGYKSVTQKVNSPSQFIERLLTAKTPVPDAIDFFLVWHKDDKELILYDKNQQPHTIYNDKSAKEIIYRFLRTGSIRVSYIFEIDTEQQSKITGVASKEWNHERKRNMYRNEAESFLQRCLNWSFDLKHCNKIYDFMKCLCKPENRDVGYLAINDAIKEKAASILLYDPIIEDNDSEKLRMYLQPRTKIYISSTSTGAFEIEKVVITPNINVYIKDLSDKFENIIEQGELPYTITDFFDILGRCAYKATYSSQDYTYTLTELHDHELEIIRISNECGVIWYNNTTKSIGFTHKLERVIFSAIHHAKLDNQIAHTTDPSILYELLHEYPADKEHLRDYGFETVTSDQMAAFEKSHYSVNFNWEAIYYCTYAQYLEENARKIFLEKIKTYALEYSTGLNKSGINKRLLQIKALTIISYYLIVSKSLTHNEQIELFQIAYAENMYPIQAILIRDFLKMRPFFKKYVKKSFTESCSIKKYYAQNQPYYLYLQCLFADDFLADDSSAERTFFYEATKVQDYSWRKMKNKSIQNIIDMSYEKIMNVSPILLDTINQNKSINNDKILWYAYGIQLYAIAYANILIDNSIESAALRSFFSDPIIEKNICFAFILADYLTKKTNRLYRLSKYASDAEPVNKMFLLCGSNRFFCQYRKKIPRITLPDIVKQDYQKWIKKDDANVSRYIFLQMLMFSHTDFDWESYIPSEKDYVSTVFLAYDNIPPQTNYKMLYDELLGYSKKE